MPKKKKKKLERICFNCNQFFPAAEYFTEFGICLNDKDFEPYIDELLENMNYDCCHDLIERKKFDGNREACNDFDEVDMSDSIEIDDESEFGKAILSAAKNGELDEEKLNQIIFEEQIRRIDYKTMPVDKYIMDIKSNDPEKRSSALSVLNLLITQGNKNAFDELFKFLKQLPPPKTLEEVYFKKDILRCFNYEKYNEKLIPYLIDELYTTPSNNTTRQWISAIFDFLKNCPYEKIYKHLEKMLTDERFSHRLKRKIEETLVFSKYYGR